MPPKSTTQPHANTICQYCNEPFYVPKSRLKTAKYCSRRCKYDARLEKRVFLICQQCAEPFSVAPSNASYHSNLFCSRACYAVAHLPSPESDKERFWAFVDKTNDCWLWTGATARYGYGVFRVSGSNLVASRFAYETRYGPIPKGLFILHRCDNPACVNPDHLFTGTASTNAQDMKSKKRHTYGERSVTAKLTADDVRAIRHEYALGDVSQSQLGRKYGVSTGAIGSVISRKNWKHVSN